jgi:hypothetical protein
MENNILDLFEELMYDGNVFIERGKLTDFLVYLKERNMENSFNVERTKEGYWVVEKFQKSC